MSGWIAQRECAECGFSGPETEFMAAGMDPDGTIVLLHRDDAADWMVLVCCGCAAGMGRMDASVLHGAVWRLLLRHGAMQLQAEGFIGPDEPIPYAPTEKAAG